MARCCPSEEPSLHHGFLPVLPSIRIHPWPRRRSRNPISWSSVRPEIHGGETSRTTYVASGTLNPTLHRILTALCLSRWPRCVGVGWDAMEATPASSAKCGNCRSSSHCVPGILDMNVFLLSSLNRHVVCGCTARVSRNGKCNIRITVSDCALPNQICHGAAEGPSKCGHGNGQPYPRTAQRRLLLLYGCQSKLPSDYVTDVKALRLMKELFKWRSCSLL